jgi:predicted ATPase
MFRSLGIKNFKAWGEQLWKDPVELGPLTILLGANSAGKTSILQVPLLLQQTFLSTDRSLDLNLGGQAETLVDLGVYEEIIHNHESSKELGFSLDIDYADRTELKYTVQYMEHSGAPLITYLEYSQGDEKYEMERTSKAGYKLTAPGYTPPTFGKRTLKPERSLMFPAEAQAEMGLDYANVSDMALAVRRAVANIAYLGPLREKPRRSYLWTRQAPGSLGTRGENAIDALLASIYSRKKADSFGEFGPEWLLQRTAHWLREMGVADDLVLEQQGRSRYYEVQVITGNTRANLVDVGFGVSQVLPMVVLAHFVPRGATIIAEQPEIHLHPRAAVALANMMVEVARDRGVQFLVETHSEHLFRRLQFLIADEKVTAADCKLYFVGKAQSQAAELIRLEVDKFGRVGNWPDKFFGDSLGETERQMERMFSRMSGEAKHAK